MKVLISWLLPILTIGALFGENYPYRSDLLWVTEPDHPDWIYQLGEEPRVEISLYRYGMPVDGVEVRYEIGPDMLPADTSGTVNLRHGRASLTLEGMDTPGFRYLRLEAEIDGERHRHHLKLAFAPDQILPATQLPEDFEAFWEAAKAEAAACPMNVERTWVAEFSSDQVDCYLIKLEAYQKRHYVYGYLTVPKGDGPFPIVFAPPGAGIKPMTPEKDLFYAENGFIRFDMEIHGIRPDLDRDRYAEVSNAFGRGNNSYLVNGLDDRDNYYMKKVYLSCLRALDYLVSLPEWDGRNLIAQGGSQGGALALIATALDPRVTACAANHPALADMAGYKAGRAGGYPHFFTKFSGMDTPEKIQTMAYYDVVNFARFIEVPVFMTWGFNDNTCPPTTSYAVFNTLPGEKEALVTPVNEHWISAKTRRDIMHWIESKIQ